MSAEQQETCGKRHYPTEREAIRSALYASRKTGTPLRVYRCGICGGWHLTKRPKREVGAAGKAHGPMEHVALNAMGHRLECPCEKCAWLADPPPRN